MRWLACLALLAGCATNPTQPPAEPDPSVQIGPPQFSPIVDPEFGEAYDYAIVSTCAYGVVIDNEPWIFRPDRPRSGLVRGWDRGTITVVDEGHAYYLSQRGIRYELVPITWEAASTYPPCY